MENKKLNVKMIYTVIGIASLTVAFVCVVVLAVKQYRLWKSGQMYEKLAESTTVPSTTMPLEGDMDEGTTQELEGYKREAARLITKYGIDVPEKNIDFDKFFVKSDLIPAIIQEKSTGEVLMLAYMNKESMKKTFETGYTWFWSRSRQELWNKGATSGHLQKVIEIYGDCDDDTLLITVEQTGAACHTGNHSCFYTQLK